METNRGKPPPNDAITDAGEARLPADLTGAVNSGANKRRGKTRDAFALRYWSGDALALKRLSDKTDGDIIFDFLMVGEDRYISDAVAIRNDLREISSLLDVDSYAHAWAKIKFLIWVNGELELYAKLFRRHARRLTKFAARCQTHWATAEPLSMDDVRQKSRRLMFLMGSYSTALDTTTTASALISDGLADIEKDDIQAHRATFASRLRAARKAAKLTQAGLAEKIGMTQGGYTQYENMKREPSLQTLFRLSRILKRPTDWLLGLT